jgi:uncharacterized membrane protein YraQ (UPF0718 family)
LEILKEIIFKTADTLFESSFYLLIGFFFAGLVKAFVRTDHIIRHIGKPDLISVVKSALIGTPLPLCSCSVIPMAAELKRSGASKGAVVSFLISTPESGFDSVAVTYAMLDPLMTLFRPVAAFVTAFVAGALEIFFSKEVKPEQLVPVADAQLAIAGNDMAEIRSFEDIAGCQDADCPCDDPHPRSTQSIVQKLKNGLRYAFTDLLGDIAYYLLIGLVLSGIITAAVPQEFFTQYFHNEILTMFIMLLVGIPMYVCASASTPIAAALILKGISPGAALVFLLSGPATNLATITVVQKLLGTRSLFLYLFSIASVALLMGFLLNGIYHYFDISIHVRMGTASEWISDPVKYASAAVFLPLLLWGLRHEIKHRLGRN